MKTHYLLILLLAVYLIFTFFTYRNYGITYDENFMYTGGKYLYKYLFDPPSKENTETMTVRKGINHGFVDQNHIYGALLYFLNPSQSYERYHLLNLLILGLPLIFFSYLVLFKHYHRQFPAILGPIFIILTPRLLGDLPTNTKDVSFAVAYLISLSAIYLLQNKKYRFFKIILLGILFGFTQTFRILGFTLYIILFLYDVYGLLLTKKPLHQKNLIVFLTHEFITLSTIAIIAVIVMFFIWPYLKIDFIKHFIEIILVAKSYPQEEPVLTFGKEILSFKQPWFYLLSWFFVTTPLFILFFFLSSLIFVRKIINNKLFIILIIALIVNIIFYAVLKPVIYDGIRHYLFLLVIVVLLACISFIEMFLQLKGKPIFYFFIVFVLINAILVAKNMLILHPYEYIYFNEAVGGLRGAYTNFETDYWGASYKEAVEWLKTNKITQDKTYYFLTCGQTFASTYYFAKNMFFTDQPNKVDYFICFTRWNQYLQVDQRRKIYAVQRFGVPLNLIYALK